METQILIKKSFILASNRFLYNLIKLYFAWKRETFFYNKNNNKLPLFVLLLNPALIT